MVQRRNSSFISLFFMMACATQVHAAEPVSLHNMPFSKMKQMFQIQTPGLLKSSKVPSNDLQIIQQNQDKQHVTHVRLQQYYLGFPVYGGYAIVHGRQSVAQMWGANHASASMNGQLYQGLKADLGQPTVDFVGRGADALEHFKTSYPQQQISEDNVQPMIYIDKDFRAHWAYKLSLLISPENHIPERPTAIVDAQTYQPFVQWNDMKTARSKVMGLGFSGNVHTGLHQFGGDLPKLQMTRDNQLGVCYMENAQTKVVDMMHRYRGRNVAMHFLCNDSARQGDDTFMTGYQGNGYDKVNGAFSPSNDALYSGNIISDMYKTWYGIRPIEDRGKEKPLIMRVHFGVGYDNAFWDGQQMTFGDGGSHLYPLVSLGVAAHEISHGFTEHHSDLAYYGQSGAMNESFSDMAAQTAEYFSTGSNDWTIGAELVKPNSGGMTAFRFMDRPSRDGVSIDSADQYQPEMDVHYTSGVYNRLFYLLSTQPGWDVRRAFEVMLAANAYYWTPTTTFDEGACGILDAAKSLNYNTADVKLALDQVAVHYANCLSNE